MKLLLTIFFALSLPNVFGQNYQCLQLNEKVFFSNEFGYLRGMRIDSANITPDSVVYWPFHTPRCFNPSSSGITTTLDSNGGSWLGKKCIQYSDGTFISQTIWGDTIVIKTQAVIGDTWMFYRDMSERRYIAEMIGQSTTDIFGTTDTIKKILITAYDDSGIVYSDPANGIQIVLSKNNGFYKVCDLYLFPYHDPGHAYTRGLDYFLDRICADDTPTVPTSKKITFTRTLWMYFPTYEQIYRWYPGGSYEFSISDPSHPGDGSTPYQYLYIRLTGTTTLPGGSEFTYDGWKATQQYTGAYVPNYTYPYAKEAVSGTLTERTGLLTDTVLMPEEFRQTDIIHLFPEDDSYCLDTRKYVIEKSGIIGNEWVVLFDSIPDRKTYKLNLGLVSHFQKRFLTGATSDTTLKYYKMGGFSCNSIKDPTGIEIRPHAGAYEVYPNPANEQLFISSPFGYKYSIRLQDAVGRIWQHTSTDKNVTSLNTRDMPQGLYLLCISDESGLRQSLKVLISH